MGHLGGSTAKADSSVRFGFLNFMKKSGTAEGTSKA